MAKNYYEILGVDKNASEADIKSAYRNLTKKYHPDKFAQSPEAERKAAEEKFKEINQAYSVLSDQTKRSNYDQFGSEDGPQGGGGFWHGGSGGMGGFDDIFSNIFSSFSGGGWGSNSRNSRIDGDDITYNLTLTFKEAAFGVEKDINISRVEECSECHGTGAKPGTAYKTCPKCGGTGTLRYTQNTPLGQMVNTRVCDSCKGTGKVILETCPKCGGKAYQKVRRTVTINIPAGVDNGQIMTCQREGDAGRNGGDKGNLNVVFTVRPHPLFTRKGSDLYLEMPITYTQAALGAKVDVPTLTDPVTYTIPEGTLTGTTFRIKGKGLKVLRREAYGDLYLTVLVETPKNLNSRQKELLTALNTAATPNQYPKQKAFYESLKNI